MASNHFAAPRRYIVNIIGGCGRADLRTAAAAMTLGLLPLSAVLLSGATAFAVRPALSEIPGGPFNIKMPDEGSAHTIQVPLREFPLVAREPVGYGWQLLPDSVPLFIGDSRVLDMPRA